ncbi:MAG: Wzz/FepE/Etk N-terminal domain-containing protein [Bacteroidota bacterium]
MSDTNHPSRNNDSNTEADSSSPQEASLLDLLLIVARNRKLIITTTFCCATLALLLALFSASKYTASAKVIREVETDNSMRNLGGLSLLSGIGLNLGGSSTGLTPDAYPDVLSSREVRLAVVRDTFYFRDIDQTLTFTEYANRENWKTYVKRFTIGLPGTIIKAIRPPVDRTAASAGVAQAYPTVEEEEAIKYISELIGTAIDQETGLMIIASTTHDPFLSRDITQRFVEHLVERIETIRTQKAKRDLNFIKQRYEVARDSLVSTENSLAFFNDRNTNPQSARLRTQQARLQRQVTFKSELFSDLQAQLTQAEIDLQRSRPVITLLEKPVPPIKPSGPRRLMLIAVGIIVGLILGVGLALVTSVLENLRAKQEEEAKLDEIATAFSPSALAKFIRPRLTSKTKQ